MQALVLTYGAVAQPTSVACPPLSSNLPFAFPALPPGPINIPAVSAYNSAGGFTGGTGIELIDVNDDSLPDFAWSFWNNLVDGDLYIQCIYLNTGCRWVYAPNYTGPDNSCLPQAAIVLRNVSISFAGLTVKQFAIDVAEQFNLATRSAVTVRLNTNGLVQGLNHRMDYLAATPGGFTVQVENEEFSFAR